jgi:hypothetical protein
VAGLLAFSTFHLALYVLLGVLGNKLARRTSPRSILSMARLAPWALGGQCSLLVAVQGQEEELAEFAGESLLVVCMLISWCLHGSSTCVLLGQYVVSSQEAKEVIPMSLRTYKVPVNRLDRGEELLQIQNCVRTGPYPVELEANLVADNFFFFFDQVQKANLQPG